MERGSRKDGLTAIQRNKDRNNQEKGSKRPVTYFSNDKTEQEGCLKYTLRKKLLNSSNT